MKNFIKKIRENDFLRFTVGFIKTVFSILAILVVAVILVQRISNNNVSLGGYRLYTVITESMTPVYKVGDMVLAKEVTPNMIKVGDDVVYQGKVDDFAGKTVVHRVIRLSKTNGKYQFVTKGVANTAEDPIVLEDQVVAKVIYKTFILSFISKIVNNVYGFYFAILVPFTVLIFIEIVRTVDEKKMEKEMKNVDKKEKEKEEEFL